MISGRKMGGGLGGGMNLAIPGCVSRGPVEPPQEQPPESMYLTDESGNRLVDPDGNLITEG